MVSLLMSSLLFLVFNSNSTSESQLLSSLPSYSIIPSNETCNSFDNSIQGCSEDCSGIKLCINNETFIIDCLAQSYGKNPYCNKTSNLCQADSVQCEEMRIFQCPSMHGFYPDPFDCRKYYQCYFGVPYEGFCTESIFDPEIPGCSNSVQCFNFSFKNGLCKGQLGKVVSHPLDKNVFVLCDEYPIVSRCPLDYIFDVETLNCQFDCKLPGLYTDKNNYEWYYLCQNNGLKMVLHHFKCPNGLYFNDYYGSCVIF